MVLLEQLESFHPLAGSSSKETHCPAYWHAVSTREEILAEAPCACLLNSVMYAAIGFWTPIPSHCPWSYFKRIQQNTTCVLDVIWFRCLFAVRSFPPKGEGRTFSKRMIWGCWFLFNSIFALISARCLGQTMVDDVDGCFVKGSSLKEEMHILRKPRYCRYSRYAIHVYIIVYICRMLL